MFQKDISNFNFNKGFFFLQRHVIVKKVNAVPYITTLRSDERVFGAFFLVGFNSCHFFLKTLATLLTSFNSYKLETWSSETWLENAELSADLRATKHQ